MFERIVNPKQRIANFVKGVRKAELGVLKDTWAEMSGAFDHAMPEDAGTLRADLLQQARIECHIFGIDPAEVGL